MSDIADHHDEGHTSDTPALTQDLTVPPPVQPEDAKNPEVQERFVNFYFGVNTRELTWAEIHTYITSWSDVKWAWTLPDEDQQLYLDLLAEESTIFQQLCAHARKEEPKTWMSRLACEISDRKRLLLDYHDWEQQCEVILAMRARGRRKKALILDKIKESKIKKIGIQEAERVMKRTAEVGGTAVTSTETSSCATDEGQQQAGGIFGSCLFGICALFGLIERRSEPLAKNH